jgi:hypothetical protein
MGGWTGEGKDTIIWDGTIKAKNFLASSTGGSFLLLDQTTPQTVINGTPVLPSLNLDDPLTTATLTIDFRELSGVKFPVLTGNTSSSLPYTIIDGGIYALRSGTTNPQVYLAGASLENPVRILTEPTSATLKGTMQFIADNNANPNLYGDFKFTGNDADIGFVDFNQLAAKNIQGLHISDGTFYDFDTYADIYGLKIDDITDFNGWGATNFYAIKTGTGAVEFGDVCKAAGYKSSDGSAGITATITTAKLTAGGANGSMTFKNGLLTAQTAAT